MSLESNIIRLVAYNDIELGINLSVYGGEIVPRNSRDGFYMTCYPIAANDNSRLYGNLRKARYKISEIIVGAVKDLGEISRELI